MNTLDIIIIAIIVISAIVGLVRGLIKTVFGLVAAILTIVLTIMFTGPVSAYIINETEFDDMISEKTIELLGLQEEVSINLSETGVVDTIETLPLPSNITDSLIENLSEEEIQVFDASKVIDYVGRSIASMAVKALCFLILFIVISIILNAIVSLLDLISQLPVLNEMNRMGGFLVGGVLGIIMVWVGLLGISFVLSIQATSELSNLIETSVMTKILYYNNPLQKFIMGLIKGV